MERIQKLIARSGLCSRRAAEDLLRQGRVTVDGVVASLGQQAEETADIRVDGKPISFTEKPAYILLNKPRGYVCSLADEHAEHLVTELVADCGARVYPVGRLDKDSEGLLLLTNDGAFMQTVTHPRHQVDKIYHVVVAGDTENCEIRLSELTELDGEPIVPAQVERLSEKGDTITLRITIHQGKNRQIRRMCAKVGLSVVQLKRVAEDILTLGDLPIGKWRTLTEQEIQRFKGSERA